MKPFGIALIVALAVGTVGAEVVNVLTLGVKNDGSADVSEIVNAATKKGPLFFPAGIYRVSKPLRLKNPIRGEGYSRLPKVDMSRTWFDCDIDDRKGPAGVIEFGGDVVVNVENLNIRCKGRVDGIRITDCRQSTATYIDKVGIFKVRTCGLWVKGWGSRPIFAGDMTIFGDGNSSEVSEGIRLEGAVDCRLSNIEVMGTCIGLVSYNGHTYADNLHLWTGIMGRKTRADWWKDTRSLVLGNGSNFAGSNIYPDTSYYAVEMRGKGAICELSNVMYWEDGSVAPVRTRDGAFLNRRDGSGRLIVHGGLVGVQGTDAKPGAMSRVYSPGQAFRDVLMKCNYEIRPGNLDRLCLGGELPDYEVSYATNGFCKVADVLTPAKTGSCEARLVRDDGATWRLGVVKTKDGRVDAWYETANALADSSDLRMAVSGDHVKVYVRAPGKASPAWTARFTTVHMTDYCRPVDHGSLRDHGGLERYRETQPVD